MLELEARPASVAGPIGPVTIADLPSSCATYWVARRKAELLAAIDGGLIGLAEACHKYRLSQEEIDSWRRTIDRSGIPGLRVTKMRRNPKRQDLPTVPRIPPQSRAAL